MLGVFGDFSVCVTDRRDVNKLIKMTTQLLLQSNNKTNIKILGLNWCRVNSFGWTVSQYLSVPGLGKALVHVLKSVLAHFGTVCSHR